RRHTRFSRDWSSDVCSSDLKDGMINVLNKLCIEPGCTVLPSFNYPGEKKKLYCKKHAKDGMISLTNVSCVEQGCDIVPSYNYPGEKKKLYCKKHAKAGIDRKSTRLNSSHVKISYAVFCLKKKKKK